MKTNQTADLRKLTNHRDRPPAPSRPVSAIPSVAQALLPSTICSSLADIVKMLDDHAVTDDGVAVYQAAYQVIWSFLVEHSNMFLKYFMEKLTRDNQEEMFQIIRNLIRKG